MADEILDLAPIPRELDASIQFEMTHTTWSAPIELFDEPDPIEQISLSFDQLGRPIVFYRVNGNQLKLRWYDSMAGQNVTTLIGYGTDPQAAFDNPTDISAEYTDVLLHYVRKNRLFMRVQRDRFLIEYPVFENQPETVARLSFNTNFEDLTGQPWFVDGNVSITPSGFFGAAGLFAGGSLTATDTDDWAFPTKLATVGFRLYPQWVFDATETSQFVCGNWSTTGLGTGWGIYARKNGKLELRVTTSTFVTSAAVFTDGLWSAIAVVFNNNEAYVFNNGAKVATFDITSLTFTQKRAIKIGISPDLDPATLFTMDGFYIIKGLAQYTSDYEVPKVPQPLWVGGQQTSVDGLVLAVDFRAGYQPWVSRAAWTVKPQTRQRYLPEHNDVFLDLTYADALCGLESTSWDENVRFYLNKFSIRFKYIKPDIPLVDQTEEIIYNFHGGHLYPTGFMFGIKDKGYPFFRWLSGGLEKLVVSPTYFATDVPHEVLFTRDVGVMYIYVDGTYVGQAEMAETVNIQQPSVVGYRYEPTAASTAINAYANRCPFRGYLSAIEIYNGVVIKNANYNPIDFPLLRQPDSNTSYLSGDGVRLVESRYREDNRFQLEYRKPLDNASTSKNRYVARCKEHYKVTNPVSAIGIPTYDFVPFTVKLLVEDFEHSDASLGPIVILGDLEPWVSSAMVPVADILDSNDVKTGEWKVRLPTSFSMSVIPAFNKAGDTRKGSRQMTVTPYKELIVITNGYRFSVMLSKPFGRGYWEFTFRPTVTTVKCDGIVVGSRTGYSIPSLQRTDYGYMFSTRPNTDTIQPLDRFILSEIEIESDWRRTVNGQNSGSQKYSITTPGELAASSDTGHSPITIVNGAIDRWI